MYGIPEMFEAPITPDEIKVLMEGERRKPCNSCATYEVEVAKLREAIQWALTCMDNGEESWRIYIELRKAIA